MVALLVMLMVLISPIYEHCGMVPVPALACMAAPTTHLLLSLLQDLLECVDMLRVSLLLS